MVDDESKPERRPAKHMKTPREWDLKHNPAYAYYAFYTYANLFTLNKLREARGLNTFALRPHAGEFATCKHACYGLVMLALQNMLSAARRMFLATRLVIGHVDAEASLSECSAMCQQMVPLSDSCVFSVETQLQASFGICSSCKVQFSSAAGLKADVLLQVTLGEIVS